MKVLNCIILPSDKANSIKVLLFISSLLREFQSYWVMLHSRHVGEGEGEISGRYFSEMLD